MDIFRQGSNSLVVRHFLVILVVRSLREAPEDLVLPWVLCRRRLPWNRERQGSLEVRWVRWVLGVRGSQEVRQRHEGPEGGRNLRIEEWNGMG